MASSDASCTNASPLGRPECVRQMRTPSGTICGIPRSQMVRGGGGGNGVTRRTLRVADRPRDSQHKQQGVTLTGSCSACNERSAARGRNKRSKGSLGRDLAAGKKLADFLVRRRVGQAPAFDYEAGALGEGARDRDRRRLQLGCGGDGGVEVGRHSRGCRTAEVSAVVDKSDQDLTAITDVIHLQRGRW